MLKILIFEDKLLTTPSRSWSKASGVSKRSVKTSGVPLGVGCVVGGGGSFFLFFCFFPLFLFEGLAVMKVNITANSSSNRNNRDRRIVVLKKIPSRILLNIWWNDSFLAYFLWTVQKNIHIPAQPREGLMLNLVCLACVCQLLFLVSSIKLGWEGETFLIMCMCNEKTFPLPLRCFL